jgi:pilus assembly protein Flp/PilA
MKIRSMLVRLANTLRLDDEDGQGLAEYALILGLIAIVAIVALLFMGGQVSNKLSVIGSQLQSVAG